jgi:hypothetical protein
MSSENTRKKLRLNTYLAGHGEVNQESPGARKGEALGLASA